MWKEAAVKGWHEVLEKVREARVEDGLPGEVSRPYLRCTAACLRFSDIGVVLTGDPVYFGWTGCPVHGVEAQKAAVRDILEKGAL